jgi:hypothetical protein
LIERPPRSQEREREGTENLRTMEIQIAEAEATRAEIEIRLLEEELGDLLLEGAKEDPYLLRPCLRIRVERASVNSLLAAALITGSPM